MNEVKTWPVAGMAIQGGNILEQLSSGALVTFNIGSQWVAIEGAPDNDYGALYLKENAPDVFKLLDYIYDQTTKTATAFIESVKLPGYYWHFIDSAGGLNHPIIIITAQDTIVLSLSIGDTSLVNIKRTGNHHSPFVQGQQDTLNRTYLSCDFDSSLSYNFSVGIQAK
jgi:hypothetical protein